MLKPLTTAARNIALTGITALGGAACNNITVEGSEGTVSEDTLEVVLAAQRVADSVTTRVADTVDLIGTETFTCVQDRDPNAPADAIICYSAANRTGINEVVITPDAAEDKARCYVDILGHSANRGYYAEPDIHRTVVAEVGDKHMILFSGQEAVLVEDSSDSSPGTCRILERDQSTGRFITKKNSDDSSRCAEIIAEEVADVISLCAGSQVLRHAKNTMAHIDGDIDSVIAGIKENNGANVTCEHDNDTNIDRCVVPRVGGDFRPMTLTLDDGFISIEDSIRYEDRDESATSIINPEADELSVVYPDVKKTVRVTPEQCDITVTDLNNPTTPQITAESSADIMSQPLVYGVCARTRADLVAMVAELKEAIQPHLR